MKFYWFPKKIITMHVSYLKDDLGEFMLDASGEKLMGKYLVHESRWLWWNFKTIKI